MYMFLTLIFRDPSYTTKSTDLLTEQTKQQVFWPWLQSIVLEMRSVMSKVFVVPILGSFGWILVKGGWILTSRSYACFFCVCVCGVMRLPTRDNYDSSISARVTKIVGVKPLKILIKSELFRVVFFLKERLYKWHESGKMGSVWKWLSETHDFVHLTSKPKVRGMN